MEYMFCQSTINDLLVSLLGGVNREIEKGECNEKD